MAWTAFDIGLFPGGNYSLANGVSTDGSVVVGQADTGDMISKAFRWTSGGGMVDIGLLPGGNYAIARGVSGDGTVVVGDADIGDFLAHAFRWTSGGGMEDLGFLGTGDQSIAYAVSNDGTTIVGYTYLLPSGGSPPATPFLWTSGGGMVDLGILAGNLDGIATCVSADGTAVAGGTAFASSNVPWIWTLAGGLVAMDLEPTQDFGDARGLSTAGNVATGISVPALGNPDIAFRWADGAGATLLGPLLGSDYSRGFGVSGDGMTIVGDSSTGGVSPFTPIVWTPGDGVLALPFFDVDLDGRALAISSDGLVAVGWSGVPNHAVYWVSDATPPDPPPPDPGPIPEQATPQNLGRWRGAVGLNWLGMALVGDAFSNTIGRSDFSTFTEYGNRMEFLVTTPPLHDDRKRIFVPRFEVEVEAGKGLLATPNIAPLLMLDYSKDGGITWAALQSFRSMGAVGEYIKRLQWSGLGSSRTWIFRMRYTGSTPIAIIGAYHNAYKSLG